LLFLLIDFKFMSSKRKNLRDPVCGINSGDVAEMVSFSYDGKKYFFCGEECRNRFKKNPKRFLKKPLLQLKNVWKTFQLGSVKAHALRGLDINIWKGDFVAIIGSSGSGKSTTLNMIALLDRNTGGKVLLNGKDLSYLSETERVKLRSETFGFVFQQYNLIPWLTAYENVTLPLLFASKPVDEKKINGYFKRIGLFERMHHRPFEMSGGEQQRVALLRALVNNPEIVIGDEPTGNLDSKTGKEILRMLFELNRKEGKTLIIVTHDISIAEQADHVIVIKDGRRGHRQNSSYKNLYT